MQPIKVFGHTEGREILRGTIFNVHLSTDNKEYFLVAIDGTKELKFVEVSTLSWTYIPEAPVKELPKGKA